MTENCPNCAGPLEQGATYCTNCGYNLQKGMVDTVLCPTCGRTFTGDTLYCTYDGSAVVRVGGTAPTCPLCGTIYGSDAKYCTKDGTKLEDSPVDTDAIFANPRTDFYYLKAPLGKRFAASVLDSVVGLLLSLPAGICFYSALANMFSDTAAPWFLAGVALYLIPVTYVLIKDGLGNGQSIGKKAMDLMVVDLDGNWACSKPRSLVRNLVSQGMVLVPYILFLVLNRSAISSMGQFAVFPLFIFALIEPLMVLVRPDGRKLADLAANTMVVENAPKQTDN